jgi:glutaredoxin
MKHAIIWSQLNCAHCVNAKRLLLSKGYTYTEKIVGGGGAYTKKDLLQEVPTARTVPQIFINGEYVGGYTDLLKVL